MADAERIERVNGMTAPVQTITIRRRGDLWFATSEDEPTIFVSANTRDALNVVLAHALTR